MKFIPILFSTPMVKAIIEGRKTVTRRVMKPQPIDNTEVDGNFYEGMHKGYVKVDGHSNWSEQFAIEFSKYQIGDILWVRETWAQWEYPEKPPFSYAYKADGFIERYGAWEQDTPKKFHDVERIEKWKPSIFMPKQACRLFLQVESVRPERLQDITEEDAIMEGIFIMECEENVGYYNSKIGGASTTAKKSFEILWKEINGEDSWNINPWVWRIEFKKIERPAEFLNSEQKAHGSVANVDKSRP